MRRVAQLSRSFSCIEHNVIASQCAHWRGNPLEVLGILEEIATPA